MKFSNDTLRAAVKEWLYDAAAGEATYGHISSWNTSEVTDMSQLFKYAPDSVFCFAKSFNHPIGDWDVSNVNNMSEMFFRAEAFNQPIGNWDVSNVTDMTIMFRGAIVFNQDLSSWSVEGVTQCVDFSTSATSWTLPQPNFTNCTP